MAKYRPVYTKIYKDPDFQNYSPTKKLIFLYLCTNESTTDSGIYPITFKTISDELDIPLRTVREQLENGSIKNIMYDLKHQYVFVVNFKHYNTGGKPEFVAKGIANDYKRNKNTYLWKFFFEEYSEYKEIIRTVGEPLVNRSGSFLSNPIPNPIPNPKKENNIKEKFLDEVFLTKKEYSALIEKFGEEETKNAIERLDHYIGSRGLQKKYKSHYKTILTWNKKDPPKKSKFANIPKTISDNRKEK